VIGTGLWVYLDAEDDYDDIKEMGCEFEIVFFNRLKMGLYYLFYRTVFDLTL
jgi:hypothetical protein